VQIYLPTVGFEGGRVRIVVLGVGRVGRAIVHDLARDEGVAVTAADRDAAALAAVRPVAARTVEADLGDPDAVARLAAEHDLVVGAGPAVLGHQTLAAVIDAGRSIVDISFFPEDPFDLDEAARARGLVAVVDAGVAPGLASVLYGRHDIAPGAVRRFVCYVGGLPETPSGPFRYKAPFAPSDVVELYTRPARHRAAGAERTDPALSLRQPLDFPGVGTLEAFLTDGLRTLLRDTHVPEMREMTLRYPGHLDQMLLLRDLGLFETAPVEVDGAAVRPRAVLERLLFPLWEFAPGEGDLTAMRVEVDVEQRGTVTRHQYDLLDRFDHESGISSMARTTGYTCTAVARLVASGRYARTGLSAPEDVGRAPGCCDLVLRDLAERGVRLEERALPVE